MVEFNYRTEIQETIDDQLPQTLYPRHGNSKILLRESVGYQEISRELPWVNSQQCSAHIPDNTKSSEDRWFLY